MKQLVLLALLFLCIAADAQTSNEREWADTMMPDSLRPRIVSSLDSLGIIKVDTIQTPKCLVIRTYNDEEGYRELIAIRKKKNWMLYEIDENKSSVSVEAINFNGKGQKELLIIVSTIEADHGMHGGFQEERELTYLLDIDGNRILFSLPSYDHYHEWANPSLMDILADSTAHGTDEETCSGYAISVSKGCITISADKRCEGRNSDDESSENVTVINDKPVIYLWRKEYLVKQAKLITQ